MLRVASCTHGLRLVVLISRPSYHRLVEHITGKAPGQLKHSVPRFLQAVRAAQMGTATKPTNRLASEESPYLLQHQHNPVSYQCSLGQGL